ncbi:UNVERIFIED_CONTAM: hypothetical protein RF649_02120 [Kocuria sp. CPCC 205295]|uniref:hypothetical protein n=1 Tax=unclassified Kocuria TaxID=2649579 RepID=UPI0034D757DA
MRQRVHYEAAKLRAHLSDEGADGYDLAMLTLSNRKASDIAKVVLDLQDGVRADRGWDARRTTYADPTPATAIRNILREYAR